MMATTYPLTFGGIKKLLLLTEKFHVTDIVVQVRYTTESKLPRYLHNATISDGYRYLPALFTNLAMHQLQRMDLGVYRIRVVALCPFPLEDSGFCNTLVIQDFEKCADPLHGIIGKPHEDVSHYRNESLLTEAVVPIAVLSLFPVASVLPPILARVTYKSRMHDPYHSQLRRPSFVIHLMDESSEIRAEVEGWLSEFAEEIYHRLQEGKTYYISNLSLVNNGGYFDCINFANLKNENLLSLTRCTVIEECTVITNLPPYAFDLTTIPVLHRMELTIENPGDEYRERKINRSVDTIGIVSEISILDDKLIYRPAVRVPFRHITIFDQSRITLSVILWSYNAEEFTARQGDVIAIRNAHLVDFPSGMKQLESHKHVTPHRVLSVVSPSTIHIEPEIEECFALRHWYNTASSESLRIQAGFSELEAYHKSCE